jgi:hypothetical protein
MPANAGKSDAAADADAAESCRPSASDYNARKTPKACPSGWSCTDIIALSTMAGVTHIGLKQ